MGALKAPRNLVINFAPSERQYELWNLLQPNRCPHCGGEIIQVPYGIDKQGHPTYKAQCKNCGSRDLPQIILGGGSAGGGKSQSVNSKVLTPSGWTRMGDITVGTEIMTPFDGVSKVTGVFPQGVLDVYEVETADGRKCKCSLDHLWTIRTKKQVSKYRANGCKWSNFMELTTKQVIDKMESGSDIYLPLPKAVEFEEKELPIPPYILGVMLGDGLLTSLSQNGNVFLISNAEEDVLQKVYELSKSVNRNDYKNSYTHSFCSPETKKYFKYIREEGLGTYSYNKFIPKIYLNASVSQRKQLLYGLMDTDGNVEVKKHSACFRYTTTSSRLKDDIIELCHSLGFTANYGEDNRTDKYTTKECFRINIRTDEPIFTSKKHMDKYNSIDFDGRKSSQKNDHTKIVSIKKVGSEECQCILIDDDKHLYITDDYIVTHNSFLGSAWLVSSCIRFADIRAVVARKTLKMLKESTWNTIKTVVKLWGLKEGVNYKINNLEGTMTFWNSSVIIMKEMVDLPSDPNFERFGSSEYTIAFVDEVSEISERAVEVLFSRLRWNVADTFAIPRMLLSTNPCLTWVRSRFVQDDDGNPVLCKEGEAYVPFSVFDNPNESFRIAYVSSLNKITDKATRERLIYGNWDFIDSNDMAAYWKFDGNIHIKDHLREKVYNPLKPLIISWDFNVSPFMSTLVFQIDYEKKNVYILEEILGKPEKKENNTPRLAKVIERKYVNEKHLGGLFITGDPAGLARSTQTEEGVNNFTIITSNIQNPILKPRVKLLRKQPPQVARLEFVNNILDGYDGWSVMIDGRCRRFVDDMVYQMKNSDGTKCKQKVNDPKTGLKFEKYGHLSDCFDYVLCLFLDGEWKHFNSVQNRIATVRTEVYGGFSF